MDRIKNVEWRFYPISQPSIACFHAWRFTSAMDSVSGISFGHAFTQFCELAQSCTPPGCIKAPMRSRACIAPVGGMLKRRTWLMIAAPTKSPAEVPVTCGQTSRQLPQELHVESLYAFYWVSGATRGPSPKP